MVRSETRRSQLQGALRLLGTGLMLFLAGVAFARGFNQINLVSDLPGVARYTDPNLINPWGIFIGPRGDIQVSDNGTGLSTAYQAPLATPTQPIFTIPPPMGSTSTAAPTGIVANFSHDFLLFAPDGRRAPSVFIFATEDGTVSGWNPKIDPNNAILRFDNSNMGSVFKGIALGTNCNGNFIFVTDFHNGVIYMLDGNFNFIKLFFDPNIPVPPIGMPGFAPFGIRNINGLLYVTYAFQNAAQHDDVAGLGNGFVDVFDTYGNFVRRFASNGPLNSPWGLVVAPPHFDRFGNALLVGNFGDGHISAYNLKNGAFLGQLKDPCCNPIAIQGLWGLTFRSLCPLDDRNNTLFFTAGIQGEAHGLLGILVQNKY